MAVLGGALAFAIVGFYKGQTAGWYRYFISAVPLGAVFAGLCFADRAPQRGRARPRTGRRMAPRTMVVLAILLLGPAIVSSGAAMADPTIGREEYVHLSVVFHAKQSYQAEERGRYPRSVALAHYFDRLKLPDSSVIVDTFTPCVPFMILASNHPRQFIITNDRDFKPILADPVTFKARYLLDPEPTGVGQLDALNKAYPDLYSSGAQIANQVAEFKGPGCPTFRLYAVTPTP
jgi:hypothetical protein